MIENIDLFFSKSKKWQREYNALRRIILDCGLREEFKWGKPCYTLDENNIVLIHGFKEFCALLFFKGVLMKDPQKILIRQTENVQDRRQIRFKNLNAINQMEKTLKAYIKDAIRVEKSGLKVNFKKTSEFKMPAEFQKRLDADERLKTAFESLTPGRQRGYILYFSSAKQSKTREERIEKYSRHILNRNGLND